jgi:formylglycine-generating enzyme required for sulfatase activity
LHEDSGAPATVSAFRIDAVEIALWRFRLFEQAVVLGTGIPQAGLGKHLHVAGGKGLNSGVDGNVYETGWDASWSALLPTQSSQWDANLACGDAAIWSPEYVENEYRPINCVTWYEAYAFCIWDGGFLPSEAEWNYAAAGGAAQRLYPWGSTDPGTASEYAVYGCLFPKPTPCNAPSQVNIALVGTVTSKGIGAFGERDLAGNVSEWTLDSYNPSYPTPCRDCAGLSLGTQRVYRGGSFDRDKPFLYSSTRVPADPAGRYQDVGFRCARSP